ncbi:PIN domain-like protein [Suillus subaureus]|uniref:PIN domain-like protein n=1 Tax=Suillus subaureus TaxID=48587 RepID=A0A9P7JEW0_9AGAM|nr:PIN domain-like protein [Suillus subaureus]KAG1818447.1 PIN domain-like protein [Suillus subaureus]
MKTLPWLTEPFKHFAQTLGFAVHDAAGEAEAELAALSHSGVIDVVITKDSDALVFGASHVFRR